MKKKKINRKKGYTIIETMIAVALFIIIIMAGMGALLNANLLHQKSRDMRSIMDNLSFIMEDMSRNLRTGYSYRCITTVFTNAGIGTPQSCNSGGAIAFEEAHGSSLNPNDQWVYKIESTSNDANGQPIFNISKSIDSGANWVQLNPSEVAINSISGFSVSGAEPPPGDSQQPFVTIRLIGTITFKNVVTPFSLQTSVSQRLVDI